MCICAQIYHASTDNKFSLIIIEEEGTTFWTLHISNNNNNPNNIMQKQRELRNGDWEVASPLAELNTHMETHSHTWTCTHIHTNVHVNWCMFMCMWVLWGYYFRKRRRHSHLHEYCCRFWCTAALSLHTYFYHQKCFGGTTKVNVALIKKDPFSSFCESDQILWLHMNIMLM